MNAILTESGAQPAMLFEWFDGPYLNYDSLNHVPLNNGWHS
ncbi:MAG: hypothetical protein VX899_06780 [Myxococcota bacterium]|nr:hypothetical protein [Myxococcota bacterium]